MSDNLRLCTNGFLCRSTTHGHILDSLLLPILVSSKIHFYGPRMKISVNWALKFPQRVSFPSISLWWLLPLWVHPTLSIYIYICSIIIIDRIHVQRFLSVAFSSQSSSFHNASHIRFRGFLVLATAYTPSIDSCC